MDTKPTIEEVVGWFDNQAQAEADLKDAKLIYACYQTGDYEGDWIVVYAKGGTFYLDVGGHCSCNGPEWGSSPTTLVELEKRGPEVQEAVNAFLKSEEA